MKKIKVKVIGASGYGGIGITERLINHPYVESITLVDLENVGKPISEIYPHLMGFCDIVIISPDDPAAQDPADVVFFATPDGVGMRQAVAELAKGAKVIDYSGDFRFNSAEDYAEYSRRIGKDGVHASPDLLPDTVYGVPELHRNELKNKRYTGIEFGDLQKKQSGEQK